VVQYSTGQYNTTQYHTVQIQSCPVVVVVLGYSCTCLDTSLLNVSADAGADAVAVAVAVVDLSVVDLSVVDLWWISALFLLLLVCKSSCGDHGLMVVEVVVTLLRKR
jgi:hypothetical protein